MRQLLLICTFIREGTTRFEHLIKKIQTKKKNQIPRLIEESKKIRKKSENRYRKCKTENRFAWFRKDQK